MFLHLSVILFTGACVPGVVSVVRACMRGRGMYIHGRGMACVLKGACMHGAMCVVGDAYMVGGMHAWQRQDMCGWGACVKNVSGWCASYWNAFFLMSNFAE